MYTQIILLLFAVHSLSAFSIVQIELKNGKEVSGVKELSNNTLEFISDQSKLPTLREIIFVVDKYLENNEDKDTTIKKKTPQEVPIELDGSLRAFTNGHGFQFVDWELVDEHQSRAADKAEDKAEDKNDNDNDTAGDETDKHDGNHEVREAPEIGQRHLNIDKAKTSRNKMFDKMKEKYQTKKKNNVDPTEEVRRKRQLPYQNIPGGAPYNRDPTATPDYKNRMLLNRALYDNSKNVMSPALREEHGNKYDNINTVYSGGRQFGNTPRAYGMNLNNDQGYPLNYVNNMQNEPMYNYYINQPVQQRPIESTINNNPYKQTNTPEVVVTNIQQLPKSEINDIDNIQKFNQVSNHETINRVPKEVEYKNIPQVIETEKSSNNGEVNTTTLKHNKEMLHNVNQMSKKIGSIKEKVKDRFASILNTPEGRKLLTRGVTKTGHKGQITNDTATPHVQVNDLPPHSSNLTTNDNLQINPNNTIALNNIEDTTVMESDCSNERNDTNNSLVEVAENIDIKIKEIIAKPVKNTGNSNTVHDTAMPYIQVNDLPPHSTKITTNDNLQINPNNTIAINSIEDTNVIESNCSNERNDTNNSLVEVAENKDIKINETIEKPVKNTDNSNTVHDTAMPYVQVNDVPPHSTKITTNDNLQINPNNTFAINNIEDTNVIESNCSNERNDTNNSLVEVAENKDIKINETIEKPVKNTDNSNTVHDTAMPYVQVNDVPPHSTKITTNDNLQINPNNTIAINSIEDTNVIESNCSNERNDTNNSLVEVAENKDIKINETIEKPVKNTDNSNTVHDTAMPYVQVNDVPPHSTKITTNDNLQINPNNTIAINNIEDTNVIESNCSNERNDTNNSLVEVAENKDIKINETIEKPVKNTGNSNTVHQNKIEPTTNQTIVENKCENPELPATEILTTTCNETTVIEKDKVKESTSDPMEIERLNGTASTEIKEEICTELEEIIEGTKTETPVAKKTSEENCNSKEKYDADDSKVENVSPNVNFDDLLNTDEFLVWLSKWTTAYMAILKQNVEVIVKEEVAKQLEEMFSKAEKEMAKHNEKSNAHEELETLRIS